MPDRGPGAVTGPGQVPRLAELLARATARSPLDDAPGKSGAEAGTAGDRRPAVRAQAPRPRRGLDAARVGLPARRRRSRCGSGASSPGCPTASTSRSSRPPGGAPDGPAAVRRAACCSCATCRPGSSRPPTRPIPPAQHHALPAAHGGAARRVLGLRPANSTSSPRCTATWSCRRGWRRPRPATGSAHLVPQLVGQGLAAARRGGAGRRGRGHPAGLRPGPAGRRPGRHAAHVRAQQLEAGQPRHRRRGAHRAARLGAARPRRAAVRPGLVPGDQLPPPAAVQGGVDRGLPGRAGGTAASTPARGGSASSRCACSARWCSSAGRRRSAATTRSSRGGRRKAVSGGGAARADRRACGPPTTPRPPAWAGGPEQVYAPLAEALVAAAPVPLAGRRGARPGRGHRRGRPGRAGRRGAAVVAADLPSACSRRCGPGAAPGGGRRRRAAVPRRQLRPRRGRVLPQPPAQTSAAGLREARRVGRGHRRQHVRARLDPPGQGGGR